MKYISLLFSILCISISFVVTYFLRQLEESVFPYCVTHQCGVTHSFSVLDIVYIFTPFIPVFVIMLFGTSILEKFNESKTL